MGAQRGGPSLWGVALAPSSAAAAEEPGDAAGYDAPAKQLSLETGTFDEKVTHRGKGGMGVAPPFLMKRAD